MRYLKHLLLFLSIVCTTSYGALLNQDVQTMKLLSGVQYLEDPSTELQLEDVKRMTQKFKDWSDWGTEINFGYTKSAYWVRIPLYRTHDAPNEWLLEMHYAKLSELDFYAPNAQPINTGSTRSVSSKPFFDRHFVFPIDLSEKNEYFYIRATSLYALSMPLQVWQPDKFRKNQFQSMILQFMYHGGLMVLAKIGRAHV